MANMVEQNNNNVEDTRKLFSSKFFSLHVDTNSIRIGFVRLLKKTGDL